MSPPTSMNKDNHSEPDTEKNLQNGTPTSLSGDDISKFGPAPDGGFKAWLNIAGGFCIFFSCLGFTSCFGVLQEYYEKHQLRGHTPNQIAWIGSLSSFMQLAGGIIGGLVFDRCGVKVSDQCNTQPLVSNY